MILANLARRLWEGREVAITVYIVSGMGLRRWGRMVIGNKAVARGGKVLVTRKHKMLKGDGG
jgi:hydrogenase maturation factor HypE